MLGSGTWSGPDELRDGGALHILAGAVAACRVDNAVQKLVVIDGIIAVEVCRLPQLVEPVRGDVPETLQELRQLSPVIGVAAVSVEAAEDHYLRLQRFKVQVLLCRQPVPFRVPRGNPPIQALPDLIFAHALTQQLHMQPEFLPEADILGLPDIRRHLQQQDSVVMNNGCHCAQEVAPEEEEGQREGGAGERAPTRRLTSRPQHQAAWPHNNGSKTSLPASAMMDGTSYRD
mmetsp:Transcript_46800/g.130300  ORF Transcript_46800/g.130300 Transcript_46800/m.130300 type:complete len:231 (-) Transcript_46800:13-705(-)